MADDDSTYNYDDEDSFNVHASQLAELGYSCYYFGDDGNEDRKNICR